MCSITGYSVAMTGFVPPGWPTGVQPPGNPDFERSAVTWLLEVIPSDYLLHGVLRRHPIALAAVARHHLSASVEGARSGYRTARSELGPHLPPSAVEAVLTAYRSEGSRLATAARAADLVERALHGEVFVRQLSGGARSASPVPGGVAGQQATPERLRSRDRSAAASEGPTSEAASDRSACEAASDRSACADAPGKGSPARTRLRAAPARESPGPGRVHPVSGSKPLMTREGTPATD